ncbi:hypothetical protein FACS1894186_0740 [Alphaproteobacteria bacterium]|nr:hypothetical protein FACS1894186_0740 [Alphaproteobacteria bacterium]
MANQVFEDIIAFHASWIVVNSVQGCPSSCRYCFLAPRGLTNTVPIELCSPAEAISKLLAYPHYNQDIPICFLTATDPFASPLTIKHTEGLLAEMKRRNLPNLACVVTKKLIPKAAMAALQSYGNIIVYLSYSALDNRIERGVQNRDILENFKNLHKAGIKIIHYWRPFLPQNAVLQTLRSVMEEVAPYAEASVIAGLKIHDKMLNNMDFWSEAALAYHNNPQAEGFWPKGVRRNLAQLMDSLSHPLYMRNLCAIDYALKRPNRMGFYAADCDECAHCPVSQKELCQNFIDSCDFSRRHILKILEDFKLEASYDEKTRIISVDSDISQPLAWTVRAATHCAVVAQHPTDTLLNTSITGAVPVEV